MELTSPTAEQAIAIHARGLGLGRDSSPWDVLAEAWRSALWALCHPHWQPATTQKLSNLFTDLAGPSLRPVGMEESLAVRDHLAAVGDLVRLPGGEWLPAPLKRVVHGPSNDPRLLGGMPSWVIAEAYPKWLGTPGLYRTSHEGLVLPPIELEEWCSRDWADSPIRTLADAVARIEALPAVKWTPTADYDFVNRALASQRPPVGAWLMVRERLTHRRVGVATREADGWTLKSQPAALDGRMTHMACQARLGVFETWKASAAGRETTLGLRAQLPDWHWQVLLCCSLRPPVQDPVSHRWTVVVPSGWIPPISALVFTPLQMRRS